jgi:DNA-binding CsgD family transcriptional regulator
MSMSFKNFLAADQTDVGARTVATGMAVFAIILLLMGFDVVEDYRSGTELSHLMTEGLIMVVAVFGLAILLIQFRSLQHRAERLTVDLEAARREAERFREEAHEALRGLGEAIDNQFTRWGLSPAECEVGLLLLKGLSHRDIAQMRSTTETTIRQQALALYRKSGLRSRAELSAFFLEDLLLPATQR